MPQDSEPLRVAVLGDLPGTLDWLGQSIEFVRTGGVEDLLRAESGLALIFATPAEAARIAAQLAESMESPPITMLVGTPEKAHPHTWLLKALVQGKREWESTFDAIMDPVAILDRQGIVVRANVALARVLARPIKEIIALPYAELLGKPETGSSDPIADSLADAAHRTRDARYTRVPGVQQVTSSPLLDGGTLRGLVVILKDVSDLKEQQERLLQASRLSDIGQLAAGVAHEINTPLASIALRAESLLKSTHDPRLQAVDSFKNFQRYLKTIDEEIFRCKKIIGALLEFSRARKPEVRETDLNALAEKAAELVGHQMKLKQVALSVVLDQKLPLIKADDGQLRQVLIALLMNALDATSAGGHVTLETRHEPGVAVSLSVSDDGSGIAPEHLNKIFSPFFTTKPVGQGTGLGLAICHGIVTAHGGEIRVDSEPGRGTRLSLQLPVDAAERAAGGRLSGVASRRL